MGLTDGAAGEVLGGVEGEALKGFEGVGVTGAGEGDVGGRVDVGGIEELGVDIGCVSVVGGGTGFAGGIETVGEAGVAP